MASNRLANRPRQDVNAGLPQVKDELGRFVTAYSPETALQIVERISMGELLDDICAPGSGMPAKSTFHRWVVKNPELARAYNDARTLSAQHLEEKALGAAAELADKRKRGDMSGTDVRAIEVAMNQWRWSAVRRDPEKFAEKQAINVKVPVQINTMLDLGDQGGGAATAEHPNIYSLQATVEVEAAPDPDRPVVPEKSRMGKTILVPRQEPDTLKLAKRRPNRARAPQPEASESEE